MEIIVKIVSIEAHNFVEIVKRYHNPIRQAYYIILVEIKDIDLNMALQIAFKAINDIASLNGLILTLLVYGAYSKMTKMDLTSLTISQRAIAL